MGENSENLDSRLRPPSPSRHAHRGALVVNPLGSQPIGRSGMMEYMRKATKSGNHNQPGRASEEFVKISVAVLDIVKTAMYGPNGMPLPSQGGRKGKGSN